ncbi:MAG TPA: SDR family NAD(P)-dependent oxidoreductase [Bryobacteraceae bacterium]|nr:SDR family NAD(P)-dependent oxidoreductase [Bryobacteraceae bacterium]
MKQFKGRVAVVTGAASGIGRAIAERSVGEGMKVVLADIDEANLAKAEAELKASGGEVLAVKTDVAKRGDVEALARRALDSFGAVHLLVNNAGVAAGGTAWDATWNDWEWVMGVNLWGVIHGVKVFTPLMMAQNTECQIVNTSSAAGLVAGSGSATYAATKHAVVALSESMYFALQQQKSLVKVSVLCPGLVRTDIINAERHRPAELRNPPVPLTPEMQTGLAAFKAAMDAATPPSKVADAVFEAIRKEQFYILSHPEWLEVVQLRTDKLLRMENPENATAVVMKLLKMK